MAPTVPVVRPGVLDACATGLSLPFQGLIFDLSLAARAFIKLAGARP
ncbi:MAG: hypothetical protein R3F56_01430 [Planctomycetota bacterium]